MTRPLFVKVDRAGLEKLKQLREKAEEDTVFIPLEDFSEFWNKGLDDLPANVSAPDDATVGKVFTVARMMWFSGCILHVSTVDEMIRLIEDSPMVNT